MDCSTPGFPVHHQLPELTQTHVLWVNDAIQPSHPLSPPSPSALNLSQHQSLFQWVSIKWPTYWSFSISHSNEYLGLISFRIDWFDLAVLGTLRLSVFSFLVITLKLWKCILKSLTLVSIFLWSNSGTLNTCSDFRQSLLPCMLYLPWVN